jgi:hypothetical protein
MFDLVNLGMSNLILENLQVVTENVPRAKDLVYLKVEPSSIQGLGLFTYANLPPNKILFEIRGRKVYRNYDPAFADCDPNWMGTGYQEWLEMEEGDIGIYINHSCAPNVIVDRDLQVITLRAIEKKEELLMDYSTTELDPYCSMRCVCGQANCRKTLQSFQYLPLDLKLEYAKFLAPAFTGAV